MFSLLDSPDEGDELKNLPLCVPLIIAHLFQIIFYVKIFINELYNKLNGSMITNDNEY